MESKDVASKLLFIVENKISKPVDSQIFVDELNKSLVAKMESKQINEQHLIAVMKGGKTFRYDDVAELEKLITSNIEKAKKSNAQYETSESVKSMQKLLPLIREFIIATKDIDRRYMRVGTLARCEIFESSMKSVIDSAKMVIPNAKMFFMGDFLWNRTSYKVASKIMILRWSVIKKVYLYIKTNGVKVEAGSTQDGKYVKSAFYKLKSAKFTDSTVAPTADENIEMSSIVDEEVDSENFLVMLSACIPIDVRVLAQTPEVKQAKTKPKELKEYNAKIAGFCLGVAQIATKDSNWAPKEFSLDPKSEFIQAYFELYAGIKTTLRTANRDIYGKRGGEDTRSGYQSVTGKVEAAF